MDSHTRLGGKVAISLSRFWRTLSLTLLLLLRINESTPVMSLTIRFACTKSTGRNAVVPPFTSAISMLSILA